MILCLSWPFGKGYIYLSILLFNESKELWDQYLSDAILIHCLPIKDYIDRAKACKSPNLTLTFSHKSYSRYRIPNWKLVLFWRTGKELLVCFSAIAQVLPAFSNLFEVYFWPAIFLKFVCWILENLKNHPLPYSGFILYLHFAGGKCQAQGPCCKT